jgi:hypothetical protein
MFGYCIINNLYTGCAKIKKNNSGAKRLIKECQNILEERNNEKNDFLLVLPWGTGLDLLVDPGILWGVTAG